MYTRRELGQLTLGVLGAAAAGCAARRPSQSAGQAPGSPAGVRLGVQTYSFRDLPRSSAADAVPEIIAAMTEGGFRECELWSPQLEPNGAGAQWRLETPLSHFEGVRKRFNDAGLTIYAYNYSFNRKMSDAEIARGFEIARALGAEIITASSTLDVAPRVVPHAEKAGMVVAMHNHSNLKDPNEFATPESFDKAMKMSNYFKINLDIGHFTAANFDAVQYIREHHQAITNLHLKDRKKDQGDTVPWGTGDAPIREVLQLIQRERWPIRAYVEYEYKGTGTPIEESRKCLEYAKQALSRSS
jgi:sugar phosphate isomerase/epimerase